MGLFSFDDILSKDEKNEINEEIFNKLLGVYIEMQNYYNELGIALKEYDLFSNSTLDNFLPVEKKIEYIEKALKFLQQSEREIFAEYSCYSNTFRNYLKTMCGVTQDVDLTNFSYFDTYTKFKFKMFEEKFLIMRMIRASYFYERFYDKKYDIINQIEAQLEDYQAVEDINEEDLMHIMDPDQSDVFAINTINSLSILYPESDVYYKNKVLLSFINPYVEEAYLEGTFNEDHIYATVELDNKGNRLVQNNIIDSLYAIQGNIVANNNIKNKHFINRTYTLKQLLDIIFHFDKKSDKYDSRLNKYINYRLDSIENMYLMHAYMYTNYLMLDEQHLEDLDHLISIMLNNESITKGGERLQRKAVDMFFTPLVLSKENKITRVRKEED